MTEKLKDQSLKEFSGGDEVYFRNPEGSYADKLNLYRQEFGEGPFIVMNVKDSDNPVAHPQIVTLGLKSGALIKVKYGSRPPEPLEVSGFWLTKELSS